MLKNEKLRNISLKEMSIKFLLDHSSKLIVKTRKKNRPQHRSLKAISRLRIRMILMFELKYANFLTHNHIYNEQIQTIYI